MDSTETIRRFLRSNTFVDRIAGELIERLPLKLRYRAHYGRTFLHWLAFLKESEYWDKERHEIYQFEQLKQLLGHAHRNVPYYQRLFDDYGFNPDKLQGIEDINRLPYLTKDILRNRTEDFKANNISQKDLIETKTSSSTGTPLTIYGTKEGSEISEAFLCNLLDRIGCNAKRKITFFSRGNIPAGKNEHADRRSGKKLILSPGILSHDSIDRCYDLIRNFGPEYITGNKTVLLAFSDRIRENGLPPLTGLRAAFAYGEIIYPWQRTLMEESLGTRLFSSYGLTEGVLFGGECEHSNHYHLYPQKGIFEFLHKPENMFEFVGTNFTNCAMPLIRYRTSDIGVMSSGPCNKCNRNFPLIERIEGRLHDFLVNKEGKPLYTSTAGIDPGVLNNVKQFQFYQDEPGLAHLRILRRNTYSEMDTLALRKEITRLFSMPESGMKVKLVFADAIPCSASGKTLVTDQRLNIEKFVTYGGRI